MSLIIKKGYYCTSYCTSVSRRVVYIPVSSYLLF